MSSTRLGMFELRAPLGRGGLATVWRGEHVPTGAAVAIKILDRGQRAPAEAAFRAEIEAAASLHHPGILALYDHGEVGPTVVTPDGRPVAEGRPWLAIEIAQAGTLNDRIGRADWTEIQAILVTLLQALAHAHARQVIHRDLKPSNVLLAGPESDHPGWKIADFGIALADREPQQATVAGTPGYMAPEQIRPSWWHIGPWTDLYALGAIAWELVAGCPAFGHGTPQELLHRHLYEPLPLLSPVTPVPDDFEAWVRRLLAKPAASRFQRAADALATLRQLGSPRALRSSETERIASPPADTFHGEPMETHGGSAQTTLNDLLPEVGSPPPASPLPPLTSQALPLPARWDTDPAPRGTPQLSGLGLGLFGLRAVPLVARHEERDRLWQGLREVVSTRQPQAWMLSGPSGVGKSALARWLGEHADEIGGATALIARHERGQPDGHGLRRMLARALGVSGLPFELTQPRLQRWMSAHGVEDLRDTGRLARWISADRSSEAFRHAGERTVALTRWLRLLSQERPVVLCLDDIQWGPAAQDLARRLLGERDLPVMIIMTVALEALAENTDEPPEAIPIFRHPAVHHLDVTPLPDAALHRLVEHLLPLDPRLVRSLVERAAGNPLFAVQLLSDWIHRGLIKPTRRGFTLTLAEPPPMPESLHQVWAARVDPLLIGPLRDAAPAIEVAAALGMQVDHGTWRACLQRAGIDLPRRLVPTLTRARLATTSADGWRFAHVMLRESVIRTSQEAGRWAQLNEAIAEHFASIDGTDALARQGRHRLAAQQDRLAADLLLHAANRYAMREEGPAAHRALRLASQALDRAEVPPGDLLRVRWQVSRARLLRARRELERAERIAASAGRDARVAGSKLFQAEATMEQALIRRARGDLVAARRTLEEAITVWRQADHPPGLTEALRHHAAMLAPMGLAGPAQEAIEEAIALARIHDDQEGEALARLLYADIARVTGAWEVAAEACQESLSTLQRLGHRSGAADAMAGLGEACRLQGEVDQAETWYQKALKEDEALGRDPSVTLLNLALCDIPRGAYRSALTRLEALESTWSTTGRPGYLAVLHVAALPCLAALSRWSSWAAHLQAAQRLLADTGFVDLDVASHAEQAGYLAQASERIPEAREAWELALSQWEALGQDLRATRVEEALDSLEPPRLPPPSDP